MPKSAVARKSTRKRILRAALDVFSRQGYHETRMDDVARRSGTSKGALYLYFKSKEALLEALLERAARLLFRKLDEALNTPAPSRQERFSRALYSGLLTIQKHRRLARLIMKTVHLGPPFDARLLEIHQAIARRIQQELDAAIRENDLPPTDTSTVANLWVGALYGLIYQWLETGHPENLMEVYPIVRVTLLRSIGIEPKPFDASEVES